MTPTDRKISINPYILLSLLYLFANIYALLLIINDYPLTIESYQYEFTSNLEFISFFVLISMLLSNYIVLLTVKLFSVKKSSIEYGNNYGLFLFIFQIYYIFTNMYYGLNTAGVESPSNNYLTYIFYLFQIDIIFIVLGVGLKSNRWFVTNILVYLFSMFIRGWMGGLLIVFIIVLCRSYPIKLKLVNAVRILAGGSVLLAALPFIIEAKWAIRTGVDLSATFFNVLEADYLLSISRSVDYVLNRFQHLGHVILIAENSDIMYSDFEVGKFSPYWLDGLPQQFFLKLSGVEVFTFDRYLVSYLFDNENLAANTNPGVAGWLFVLREKSILFLFYLAAITIPAYIFVMRYAGFRYLLLLACFSLIYLWHGWIGAYINLLMYMVLFILIRQRTHKTHTII